MGPEGKVIKFRLPNKGVLAPNGPDDPLAYYYNPLTAYLYQTRISQAISLLNKQYESILEIGYGSGILMPTLVSIGRKVCGIDFTSDPDLVEANLKKVGVSVSLKKEDVCNSQYPDGSFDLIVAISIIEHVDNLEALVKKAHALLRPGGHFLVGMPKVGGFMQAAFHMIGYHDIKQHHINDYGRFIEVTRGLFDLIHFTRMPVWVPRSMALYFNMLLSKKG